MPRYARYAPGGTVLHVLNRRVDKQRIFHREADYLAFESVLGENTLRTGMRLCGYCLMPNHWHMVLWPRVDGEVSAFMHRLSLTHAVRWRLEYDVVGEGHLYQARFKSFPVESDGHFLTVLRYVERNALRASLVVRAEDWRFSSLWRRTELRDVDDSLLSPGPVALPVDWVERVNRAETVSELKALRGCVERGDPFGSERWRKETSEQVRPNTNTRPRGRPRKSRTS